MSIATVPLDIVKGIGNRYRIAYHENKIDDQIAPESGISGWILDKVEDTTNFLTLGAVARVKDGIKTKGYGELSGEEMDKALAEQYMQNVTSRADKKEEKQSKKWEALQSKMDKLSIGDQQVDVMRQRAANAEALYSPEESEESAEFDI